MKRNIEKNDRPIIIAAVLIVYLCCNCGIYADPGSDCHHEIIDGNYSAGTGRSSICSNRRTVQEIRSGEEDDLSKY